jgi:predicted Zn-dependent protease
MNVEDALVVRIIKRLKAAVGYYELGMMQHALDCLESLQSLGDIGPFSIAEEMLTAQILQAEHRYEAAAQALEAAARLLPAPFDQALWMAVSQCQRQAGNMDEAANSLGCARGAKLPEPPHNSPSTPGL